MDKFIFSFFVFFVPAFSLLANIKTLEAELKQARTKAVRPLDIALEKKLSTLEKEASLLKKGSSWKKVNETLEKLKKTPEYNSARTYQEALSLVDTLENFSYLQNQPELLEMVSLFLKTNNTLEQPYKTFLQKERVSLIDKSDENRFMKTKQRNIAKLRKDLVADLESAQKKMRSLPVFDELKTAHTNFLKDKKTKKVNGMIEKLKEQERQKTVNLATNKDCLEIQDKKELLLTQVPVPYFQVAGPIKTNRVIATQLDLFMTPLSIIIL